MTTAADLLEVLIAEIEDNNAVFVTDLLARARAAILGGGGEIAPLEQGTINGKTVTRTIRMDAAMVAKACREALRYTAESNPGGPVTFLDFSRALT